MFLPSLVTDRPNPEQTIPNYQSPDVNIEQPDSDTQVPDQPTAGGSHQQEQPTTSSSMTGCSQQSTSSAVVISQIRQAPSAVTPDKIQAYPTTPPRKANTNRKRGKVLTLTDIPVKEVVELAAKQKPEANQEKLIAAKK